jgi:transcriptional regulator with XRE-family HTH domain
MSVDPFYRHIGAIIKTRRETLKMKQEVLAGQLGISRGSLSNIETGRQSILVHQLYRFADMLQLSPNDLLPVAVNDHAKTERTLLPLPGDLKAQQKEQLTRLLEQFDTTQPLDKEGSHVRSKR